MTKVRRTSKPKRSLRPKRHPRPAKTETVNVYAGANRKVRFCFTTDVMEKLLDLHLGLWGAFYFSVTPRAQRHRMFRLQFVRFADLRIPAVFVMIEPPTYDPRGRRILHNAKEPNIYRVEIVATKLKMRHPFRAQHPELLWADQGKPGGLNGLILNFPDEAFDFEGPSVPLPFKSSGVSPLDLVAY